MYEYSYYGYTEKNTKNNVLSKRIGMDESKAHLYVDPYDNESLH